VMWKEERTGGNAQRPLFGICCAKGKVQLPLPDPPPEPLNSLLLRQDSTGRHFRKRARQYNTIFQMASTGANVDHVGIGGGGPPVFRIRGTVHHRMNTQILPAQGAQATFGQLYTLDGQAEVDARMGVLPGADLRADIVQNLATMLRQHNPLTEIWRRAAAPDAPELEVRLNAADPDDPRRYNPQVVPEFGAFIPDEGNPDAPPGSRQIRMTSHDGRLHYVSELHPAYDALHYPLLHPRGESGWRPGIPHTGANAPGGGDVDMDDAEGDEEDAARPRKRPKTVSAMQFAAYHLQVRDICLP
jgi:hypothetical protein